MFYLIILLGLFGTPDQNLKSSVDGFLKNKLSGYDKYNFKIIKAPEITGKYEIKDDAEINLNGSFAYIPVKILKANSGIVQTYITIRLELFKRVLVAKEEIGAKQSIPDNEVDLKIMEVSGLRGRPVESLAELTGLRSKIKIEPGSILFKESLEEIPVIAKGDRITALSISGNVKVSTEAEAKQEGLTGQVISIVTKDKKQFKAKVIDSNNVLIIE